MTKEDPTHPTHPTIYVSIPRVLNIYRLSRYKYDLRFLTESNTNIVLLRSILESNLIEGALSNERFTSLQFFAHSVVPLSEYIQREKTLTYQNTISIIWHLYRQQIIMEQHGYGFSCLRNQDVMVIDGHIFVSIHPKWIFQIKNTKMKIPFPLPNDAYLSNEILVANRPPYDISSNTFYYSLGCMALFSLVGKHMNNESMHLLTSSVIDADTGILKELRTLLEPIHQSKLYWCILRLLQIDPLKRQLLFV